MRWLSIKTPNYQKREVEALSQTYRRLLLEITASDISRLQFSLLFFIQEITMDNVFSKLMHMFHAVKNYGVFVHRKG